MRNQTRQLAPWLLGLALALCPRRPASAADFAEELKTEAVQKEARIVTAREKEVVIQYQGKYHTVPLADLPEKMQAEAKEKFAKEQDRITDEAVAKGQFRLVEGKVEDLRKPGPGWLTFRNAQVLQVTPDGYLMVDSVSSPNGSIVFVLKDGVTRNLVDGDTMGFTAKNVGTISFRTRDGLTRTVRVYSLGLPVDPRKPLPTAPPGFASRKPRNENDPVASGSGFFITDDGFFVTNFHVVEDAKRVEVKNARGKFTAEIVKVDRTNDLALLKVKGDFRSVSISTNAQLSLGESVFTIGYPNVDMQGVEPKYTDGKISGLFGMRDDPRDYQISVPVQPGNSGGPLIDAAGNVAGVVVARLNDTAVLMTTGTVPQNVNYAIKGRQLQTFIRNASNDLRAKLKPPIASKALTQEQIIKNSQEAAALVLVY